MGAMLNKLKEIFGFVSHQNNETSVEKQKPGTYDGYFITYEGDRVELTGEERPDQVQARRDLIRGRAPHQQFRW